MHLRSIETPCAICRMATLTRVVAEQWIRDLPENLRFANRLRIVECQQCGLRYLDPRPHPDDLHAIYDFDTYADSTNANPVLMAHVYRLMTTHRPKLARVLEIGCGTGDFLAWLEARGLTTEGVEFADSSNRTVFHGRLHVGRMEDLTLPAYSYDAVLLLNVIEHLADPVSVLQTITGLLRRGGILVMRHPNAALFTWPPYRYTIEALKYWQHRRNVARNVPTRFTLVGFQNQHLFYFTPRVVTRLLQHGGFQICHSSTVDPYNRVRAWRALRDRRIIEAGIAGVRHGLSAIGLGPELWTVARMP